MKLNIIIFLSIALFFETKADDHLIDPLKKPKIWKSLLSAPLDSMLWVYYFEKPWITFNVKERLHIQELQGYILEKTKDDVSSDSTTVTQEDFWEAPTTVEQNLQRDQDAFVESQKLQELEYERRFLKYLEHSDKLTGDLVNNINHNFFLIEDIYRLEFKKLNIPYNSYLETYPDSKYDKIQWISQKKIELLKLKKAKWDKKTKD